jgi:hypothetical protein
LCAVALDYKTGIFSGEDKIIAELTGKPPMTVQISCRRTEKLSRP